MTPPVNVLSFDVEDWFQVSVMSRGIDPSAWDRLERRVGRNVDRILGILDETGHRATFFILGWIAEREPALVRRIAEAGHEIASHGHAHRRITEQTPQEFREDVRRARRCLEDITGAGVAGYRAPSFSITRTTLWALDVLLEEGHSWDSSVFPIGRPDYGIPDAEPGIHRLATPGGASILECPPSVAPSWILGRGIPVAGGGYFRLLPYAVTRAGIRRINALGRPAVFYLHPWELDPGQPRVRGATSLLGGLRHYLNLGRTERRLRRLLADFEFAPVADVLAAFAAEASEPAVASSAGAPHQRGAPHEPG